MMPLYLLMILWPGTVDWQPYAIAPDMETCLVFQTAVARRFDHTMVWAQPELRCEKRERR